MDATQDESEIRLIWAANPIRLVGVWIGDEFVVLDIDLDMEKAEDGYHFLTKHSLHCPESYELLTPSGGKHIFYRNPGKPLRPDNNYRSPNKQLIRTGLDRKTCSSYVIANTDTPPKSSDLADAPLWLLDDTKTAQLNEYSGTLDEWIAGLNPSIADFRVIDAIRRFPMQDFDHQEMITKQTELVFLGAQGCSGVAEALDLLQSLWLFGPYNTEEYRIERTAALEGAVRKFGGQHNQSEVK